MKDPLCQVCEGVPSYKSSCIVHILSYIFFLLFLFLLWFMHDSSFEMISLKHRRCHRMPSHGLWAIFSVKHLSHHQHIIKWRAQYRQIHLCASQKHRLIVICLDLIKGLSRISSQLHSHVRWHRPMGRMPQMDTTETEMALTVIMTMARSVPHRHTHSMLRRKSWTNPVSCWTHRVMCWNIYKTGLTFAIRSQN